MSERRGRARMEARFGPPGTGRRHLAIGGRTYALPEVAARLGLAFDGCRVIDGFELGPAHFVLRYYDPDEQRVVAYEFDAEFRYLRELRAHIADWVGDDRLAPDGAAEEVITAWISS